MPNDPLTGSRYPLGTDAPNVAQYIQNAVTDLADNTFAGPFATATARNTAYAAWVADGGTMRNGLHCTVNGVDMVYQDGQWRGLGRVPVLAGVGIGPWTSPVSDDDPRNVATITIADPGFPFRLRTFGGVEVLSTSCRADSVMVVGGTTWDLAVGYNPYHKHAGISPVFTGGQVLYMTVYRVPGTGGGSWTSTSANLNLTAEVVPG